MIQLIDKQPYKYTMIIHGKLCVFIPMALFIGSNLFPARAYVPKGKSVLKWKVGGKEVSYNQINKAICTTTKNTTT
jgi:hypothetical protein